MGRNKNSEFAQTCEFGSKEKRGLPYLTGKSLTTKDTKGGKES
jgi:hypothetical protein